MSSSSTQENTQQISSVPTADEPMTYTNQQLVIVNNVPQNATTDQIRSVLEASNAPSHILNIFVNGSSRHVVFDNYENAENAVQYSKGKSIDNNPISVSIPSNTQNQSGNEGVIAMPAADANLNNNSQSFLADQSQQYPAQFPAYPPYSYAADPSAFPPFFPQPGMFYPPEYFPPYMAPPHAFSVPTADEKTEGNESSSSSSSSSSANTASSEGLLPYPTTAYAAAPPFDPTLAQMPPFNSFYMYPSEMQFTPAMLQTGMNPPLGNSMYYPTNGDYSAAHNTRYPSHGRSNRYSDGNTQRRERRGRYGEDAESPENGRFRYTSKQSQQSMDEAAKKAEKKESSQEKNKSNRKSANKQENREKRENNTASNQRQNQGQNQKRNRKEENTNQKDNKNNSQMKSKQNNEKDGRNNQFSYPGNNTQRAQERRNRNEKQNNSSSSSNTQQVQQSPYRSDMKSFPSLSQKRAPKSSPKNNAKARFNYQSNISNKYSYLDIVEICANLPRPSSYPAGMEEIVTEFNVIPEMPLPLESFVNLVLLRQEELSYMQNSIVPSAEPHLTQAQQAALAAGIDVDDILPLSKVSKDAAPFVPKKTAANAGKEKQLHADNKEVTSGGTVISTIAHPQPQSMNSHVEFFEEGTTAHPPSSSAPSPSPSQSRNSRKEKKTAKQTEKQHPSSATKVVSVSSVPHSGQTSLAQSPAPYPSPSPSPVTSFAPTPRPASSSNLPFTPSLPHFTTTLLEVVPSNEDDENEEKEISNKTKDAKKTNAHASEKASAKKSENKGEKKSN